MGVPPSKSTTSRIGLALATLGLTAGAAGQSRADFTIDFDAINATSVFSETTALRESYASLGVHFSGPAANSGGGILDTSSNFGIAPRSGRNFLAFNEEATFSNGGFATGPETISFDVAQSAVSIYVAGGRTTDTFRLDAFDGGGTLLGSNSATTQGFLQLGFSAVGIRSIVLTATSSDAAYVFDDLTFTNSIAVPEPSSLALCGLGVVLSTGLAMRNRRRRPTVD